MDLAQQSIWDLYYDVQKKLGEEACLSRNQSQVNIQDSLIEYVKLFLTKYNLIFAKDEKDHLMLSVAIDFDKAQEFISLNYLFVRLGDYRYHPIDMVLKYKREWEGQKFRLDWNALKIDNDNNIIALVPTK